MPTTATSSRKRVRVMKFHMARDGGSRARAAFQLTPPLGRSMVSPRIYAQRRSLSFSACAASASRSAWRVAQICGWPPAILTSVYELIARDAGARRQRRISVVIGRKCRVEHMRDTSHAPSWRFVCGGTYLAHGPAAAAPARRPDTSRRFAAAEMPPVLPVRGKATSPATNDILAASQATHITVMNQAESTDRPPMIICEQASERASRM